MITEEIFKKYHRACVDFCNYVTNNEDYEYDSQSFEYNHLKTILKEHYPNDSLSIKHMISYFTNRRVLIGFCPNSINGDVDKWGAIGISPNNALICNDFYNWKDAHDKCIEYGFQLLNELLLSTK